MTARFPALALALLATGAAFTGCIGTTDTGGGLETLSNESGNSSSIFEAPPDDREGEIVAFREVNQTESGIGGEQHDHDYWLGRSRIDLFEMRAMMHPVPTYTPPRAVFTMPKNSLVFEGTGTVEFLVDAPERHACEFADTIDGEYVCTDSNAIGLPTAPGAPDPAPPKLKLEYLHASSKTDEWIGMGDLAWGTPTIIPINRPIETDMPHSTTSLWQFRVTAEGPLDSTLTFRVKATIVRGPFDIPKWPGHPDFYANGHQRLIHQGTATTKETTRTFVTPPPSSKDLGAVRPEKLVSYGTRTLHIWANISREDLPPGVSPHTWYLFFHNASGTWNITDTNDVANATAGQAKNLYFVLPVDDNGMDSPYAPGSRWEFMLRGSFNTPLLYCYGDCATYSVTYDLTIIATDVVAEAYTPGGF